MLPPYRANLTSAEFPFLSELQGRNVIVSGQDQNYSRQLSSNKNKDRDIGIPQIYYMHNVIPTDAGVCSVGYQDIIQPPADTDNNFIKVFQLRDVNENVALLGITSTGRSYALVDTNIGWVRSTDKSPAVGRFISTAHVNGQTYIYFGKVGCFKYNFTTGALDAVALTTLDVTQILGVCASNGYMIAWTANKVFWSSTIDPTDFTPSLTTGAGSEGIQEAKAEIVCCLPQNGGFIIYTKRNAIAMAYTNNAQYPFNSREIIGAGGLADPNLAGYDGNSTNHAVYSTSGLQEISMASATIMSPQATDFLAGSQFEDFDEINLVFNITQISTAMKKRMSVVANRYIVISYGIATLTHALIYDIALARWGKLKVNHVDCFEYFYPSSLVVDAPRKSIGFLQANGTVKVATLSYDTTGSAGVMVLGKYQLARQRAITMHEIHLESIQAGNSLNVKLLTTLDGKNVASISSPYLATNFDTFRKYTCRASGLNHSIMVSGAFHVHSLELTFADGGAIR